MSDQYMMGKLAVGTDSYDGMLLVTGSGEDEQIAIACAMNLGARFPDMRLANARRLAACWNACDGLTQDHFDGGWTAKGLSQYARKQEVALASANAKIAWMRSLVDAAQAGQRDMLSRADAADAQLAGARALLEKVAADGYLSETHVHRIRAFLKGGTQ